MVLISNIVVRFFSFSILSTEENRIHFVKGKVKNRNRRCWRSKHQKTESDLYSSDLWSVESWLISLQTYLFQESMCTQSMDYTTWTDLVETKCCTTEIRGLSAYSENQSYRSYEGQWACSWLILCSITQLEIGGSPPTPTWFFTPFSLKSFNVVSWDKLTHLCNSIFSFSLPHMLWAKHIRDESLILGWEVKRHISVMRKAHITNLF